LIYREPDADRQTRFWSVLALGAVTTGLFCGVAVFGGGASVAIPAGAGLTGMILFVLNTWGLRNPLLHIFLILCAVGFAGPTSVLLAWYTTHSFGLSTLASDAGFAAFLAVMALLCAAEARQADLRAFVAELRKNGGLRVRDDGIVEFRLRGVPKTGPHGAYFRPFKWALWLDIGVALGFAVVLFVVAPFAFAPSLQTDVTREAWIFAVVFLGSGWLARAVLTGAIVNWRLLSAIHRGEVAVLDQS